MKRPTTLINNLNETFWRRISNSVAISVESVVVFRIITGLFLLFVFSPNFEWIGLAPQAFFLPPVSLTFFLKNFPSTHLLLVADILLLICSLCILLGIKTRIACLVYTVTGIACYNFQYSFGKIDHNILIFVLLLCLSFSGWGKRYALVPDKDLKWDSTIKSISLLAFIMCFAFFTTAYAKFPFWINFDINKNGTGSVFYPNFFSLNRKYLLAPFVLKLPFISFKIMDFLAVLFEFVPFFFLLYSKKAWRFWLLIAIFFHLLNTLLFNIPFIINSIVYLSFIDYSGIYKKLNKLIKNKVFISLTSAILLFVMIIRTYNALNYKSSYILFIQNDNIQAELYFCLVLWLGIAFIFINTFTIKTESASNNSLVAFPGNDILK